MKDLSRQPFQTRTVHAGERVLPAEYTPASEFQMAWHVYRLELSL